MSVRCGIMIVLLLPCPAGAWQFFSADRPGSAQTSAPASPSEAEIEQSVSQTRGLLRGGVVRSTRPWYDASSDGVRRLDLRIEQPLPSWNFSWLGPFFKILAWTGLALLLGGLLYLMVHIYLRRYFGRDNRSEDADAAITLDDRGSELDRVEALPFRVPRQGTDLLNEARRQYEAGNYSEAIVYLFSHQLVVLDKQHIIHLAKGKTNRQLVREIGPRRELRLLIEQTMVAFEDVFFGNRTLSRAGFEVCWFELDRFDRLVQEAVV